MLNLTGRTLGNYEILEEIGRGGMAQVYRAYQPSLNRNVAIKILPPQLALDRQFVDRFVREARAAASLRHPHIVIIHDVGEQDGLYYMVMEYLSGQTLRQLIKNEGPLPPARATKITEQLATALDYAHRHGFVHRDVKPSNIFVGEGDRVTLTDFGIAKAASEAQQLTRTGTLMGTPEYMSPEQAEGRSVDYRSDLYALGVVLYHMLTGRVPFRRPTPAATLHAVIYEPPPPPRQLNPSIPPAVESVVLKSVAKQPEQRYQKGAELVADLQAAFAGRAPQVVAGPPPPPLAPPQRREPASPPARRRSPAVWIMAAIAAVLLLVLGGLAVLLMGQEDETATTPGIPDATDAIAQITPAVEGEGTESAVVTVIASATQTTTELVPTDTPTTLDTSAPVATTEVPPTNTSTATATSVPATATPKPATNTPKPPTRTPTPTPTTPPPPPPCAFDAQGAFAGLWHTYEDRLGCPLYQHPQLINDAEQAFQNGHMFWRQDNDYAYVVYEQGGLAGTQQAFTDQWSEGDPNYSCSASPPPGLVQPERGFGAVWCDLGAESAPIGWGLGTEAPFGPGHGDPLVQDFDHGMILRDSDGTTHHLAYVFFWDDGTFVRQGY